MQQPLERHPMQVWDPDRYATHARFVSDLGAPVVELLDPRPGERVLDIGCGDGALTEKLVEAGCRVVAIDASPEQVRAARERGLDARVADATALDFDAEFDAVFSNAVLHWIRAPDAALAAIRRSLAPDGRLVAELGGHGCVASIRAAFAEVLAQRGIDAERLNPWYFPTAEEYRERLDANGFDVDSIRLFPRPTPLPSDVTDWLETFAQPFLAGVPNSDRPAVLLDMRERLEPVLGTAGGGWVADYVRLRFAATRRQ
jgi:trans-aconitate methyltransferase